MPTPLSRRHFIGSGLAALSSGLLARRAFAAFQPDCPNTGALPYGPAAPVLELGDLNETVMVDGLPFYPRWTGDSFATPALIPFHSNETNYPSGAEPVATENVDVCIVGGGLSGLTTAYLLREHHPVVLELAPRFGGVAKGERWQGVPFSLGGAYFMVPDPGPLLDLYQELGLDRMYKLSKDPDPSELNGELINNIFRSPRVPAAERAALDTYKELVHHYFENYPNIPLVDGQDNQWIINLDKMSFKDHVEQQLGYPCPPLVTSIIQSYFFSSFGAGWERISAASGWNFVSAEEGGRWVLPGGNSAFVQVLYERLAAMETAPSGCPGQMLRAGCHAVAVRMQDDGRAKVIYKDASGRFRALNARRVVMCCSKHIAKYILAEPLKQEPDKLQAMYQLETAAYTVANILLDSPAPHTFYDIFLYGNGVYPTDDDAIRDWAKITDVVDGGYAVHGSHSRTALTCYWPQAWPRGRAPLIADTSWNDFAARAAPQVRAIVDLLGVARTSIRQVRLTRWGHAFAVAGVGLIANGTLQRIRAPMKNTIFFVEHDNWALPAVETCLQEAQAMAPLIAAGL